MVFPALPPKSTSDSSGVYTECTSCDSISHGSCLIHRGKNVRNAIVGLLNTERITRSRLPSTSGESTNFLSVRLVRLIWCQIAGSLFSYLMKNSLRKCNVTMVSGAVGVQCVYYCD